MNYFEHHIGDYDEATSHLSACEDGVYCRLIRKYYATEKPLIADVPKLQRLVRARNREEREAVVSILEEFFALEADGWHHHVCDENIAAYQAGEPEREVKAANEKNRLQRHRDERAALFKVVTGAGEHLPWNVPMQELRASAERISNGQRKPPPPLPATSPATPATATQTPDTNPHFPIPNTQTPKGKTQDPGAVGPAAVVTPTRAGSACLALKRAGVSDVQTSHPKLVALLGQGVTDEELTQAALAVAEGKRKFAYVLGVVEGRRRDAAAMGQLPTSNTRNGAALQSDADRHAETRRLLGFGPGTSDQEIVDA